MIISPITFNKKFDSSGASLLALDDQNSKVHPKRSIWLFRRVPTGTGATRLCSKNRRRTTRRCVLNFCSVGLHARVFIIAWVIDCVLVLWRSGLVKIEEMRRMQKEMSEQGNQSLRPRLWKWEICYIQGWEWGGGVGWNGGGVVCCPTRWNICISPPREHRNIAQQCARGGTMG